MLFCDEAFRFLNLEETLYFTSLDYDFNSFTKDDVISDAKLLEINRSNLTKTFTCNFKGVKSDLKSIARPSDEQINKLIESTLYETDSVKVLYDNINQILFSEDPAFSRDHLIDED